MPAPSDPALVELGLASAELAHELRNLLATIATSAHAAEVSPEEAPRFLQRIGRTVDTAQRLVDDVLALATVRHLEVEPLAVSELLHHAREGLDADFVDELEGASLHGHPALLPRALHALYANAVAVSARPRARIVTRVHAVGGTVYLDVEDDGPGVPPEVRASLFTPFTSARPGGHGLGLALAHRIVEAHDGRLTLQDDAASTTFRIALPRPPR
jgi:signal transduction histidine kinase